MKELQIISCSDIVFPYVALIDYISAITFIFTLWIPSLFIIAILTFLYWIKDLCCGDLTGSKKHNDNFARKNYKHTDFDEEYLPDQFKTL